MKQYLFIFTSVLLMTTASPALANLQCGKPVALEVKTDRTYETCNIYSRQLAYKEVYDKLKADLIKSQESYARQHNAVYEQYRKDIDRLHGFSD